METNIFQSGGIEKAGLARPTPIFMQPEVRMDNSLITVSYAYDSLYRLTVANAHYILFGKLLPRGTEWSDGK